MSGRWIIAAVLFLAIAPVRQETAVLHVRIVLTDTAGQAVPVARHGLLVSENPASAPPRLLRTAADGTLDVTLAPGSYAIESERAVMFQGTGYEWFQYIDVEAGQELTLELTASNAAIAESDDPSAEPGLATAGTDLTFLLSRWQRSVVAIWSPTARATGVVVDARGLVATHAGAVGDAPTVAVQLSESSKVAARVSAKGPADGVAIVRVNPAAIEGHPPIPVECTPESAPLVVPGNRLVAITSDLRRPLDVALGDVTSATGRVIATDMPLSPGGAGGPAFNDEGRFVGVTLVRGDDDGGRWHDADVVPIARVCEALSAARAALSDEMVPEVTSLPIEPVRAFPVASLGDAPPPSADAALPRVVTSEDFEIAFVTPAFIHHARAKAGWTGGRSVRAPEAEARLGRVTDFGAWSSYFVGAPAVVVVRVTPKMVEGFWKRVAREAARTQGAELPPFKHFKTGFVRMTLSCGSREILPIHPFVLEHALSETDSVREGLYVYHPDAFDSACTDVRMTVYSDSAQETPESIPVGAGVVERIRNDFAVWRQAGRA